MPINTAESILKALPNPVLFSDGSLRAVLANPVFYQTFGLAAADDGLDNERSEVLA